MPLNRDNRSYNRDPVKDAQEKLKVQGLLDPLGIGRAADKARAGKAPSGPTPSSTGQRSNLAGFRSNRSFSPNPDQDAAAKSKIQWLLDPTGVKTWTDLSVADAKVTQSLRERKSRQAKARKPKPEPRRIPVRSPFEGLEAQIIAAGRGSSMKDRTRFSRDRTIARNADRKALERKALAEGRSPLDARREAMIQVPRTGGSTVGGGYQRNPDDPKAVKAGVERGRKYAADAKASRYSDIMSGRGLLDPTRDSRRVARTLRRGTPDGNVSDFVDKNPDKWENVYWKLLGDDRYGG